MLGTVLMRSLTGSASGDMVIAVAAVSDTPAAMYERSDISMFVPPSVNSNYCAERKSELRKT